MGNVADEVLMLAYRDGDARAFETLYGRHKDPLYRYLLRQCRTAAIAEELFQETWMSVIRARERYEPRAKFTTYMYRIAHNHLIDYYRRQSSGIPISYESDPDALTPEQLPHAVEREPVHELDTRRQVKQLLTLIDKLPEAQREAFLLREEGGLSLDEIAETTGVNAETAKSRLRYAVDKLRDGMQSASTQKDVASIKLAAKPGRNAKSW